MMTSDKKVVVCPQVGPDQRDASQNARLQTMLLQRANVEDEGLGTLECCPPALPPGTETAHAFPRFTK